ncbi:hypothetical protein [Plantibacter sp. YIM 135249]|uniref:hypothetical protein n=1 Tax=Plantibacter sp. YIM 135249 TaxID=3423918 RepID=UPI003D346E2B
MRLVDIPADAADDPRARQYIVDSLLPGTTITRRIEISNTTAAPIQVTGYAAAATIEKGAFVGADEREANELSSWTTLSKPTLELAAQSVGENIVTIAVPADAAPGETYAIIWAEVGIAEASGVKLVNRVGIRIYLEVRGDNPRATAFVVDSMTAARDADGRPVVYAQVHNTGGRAIDITGTLNLASVSGSLTAGPYDAALGTTVAPGQSEPIKILPGDDLAAGPWKADLQLQSGLVKERSEAEIRFPEAGSSSPPAPARRPADAGLGAILALGIGLVVLAGGYAVVMWIRRRRNSVP